MGGDDDNVSKDAGQDAVVEEGVGAVSIKLPPFWASHPSLWFSRIESQFHLRNIKSELTKFHHANSALSTEIMETVIAAVEDPKPDSAYTDLKEALLKRHGPHRPSQMMNFINSGPISPGEDPRAVYDQIRALRLVDYDIEAGHFCAKMPDYIRHDLMKDVDTCDDLQELADAARHLMKKSGGASVSQVAVRSSAEEGRKKRGLCFNHRRYGDRAWECRKPCSWTGRRPTGRPQNLRAIEDQSGNDNYLC